MIHNPRKLVGGSVGKNARSQAAAAIGHNVVEHGRSHYWLSVTFRFLRLVVVVPVMEKIFSQHC
jgi:hypothetical protein